MRRSEADTGLPKATGARHSLRSIPPGKLSKLHGPINHREVQCWDKAAAPRLHLQWTPGLGATLSATVGCSSMSRSQSSGSGGGDTCQAVRTGAGSPTDGFLKSHSATQAHPASTHSFTKNSSPCPQITRHARGGRAFLTATPLPRSLSPPAFFLPSSIEDAAFISWLQISNFVRRASRQPTQSPPTLPMARCPALAS